MRRDRREEIQNKLDIVCSDRECRVCRTDIGGGEITRLDFVSRVWHTEQTIGCAIDSGHDRPSKLLAMVKLSHGSWQVRTLVARKPC